MRDDENDIMRGFPRELTMRNAMPRTRRQTQARKNVNLMVWLWAMQKAEKHRPTVIGRIPAFPSCRWGQKHTILFIPSFCRYCT